MNKQGKLFGKVSIIDILAVIAIIVMAVGIYFRFVAPSGTVVTDSHPIEYTMRFREVRMPTVLAFQKKGPVSDATTHEDMGEIVSVDYAPAKVKRDLENGTVAEIEVPEKYDVYVTMRVDGKQNKSGYYTQKDNKVLGIGSGTTIDSKYVECYGEIVAIDALTE